MSSEDKEEIKARKIAMRAMFNVLVEVMEEIPTTKPENAKSILEMRTQINERITDLESDLVFFNSLKDRLDKCLERYSTVSSKN